MEIDLDFFFSAETSYCDGVKINECDLFLVFDLMLNGYHIDDKLRNDSSNAFFDCFEVSGGRLKLYSVKHNVNSGLVVLIKLHREFLV